MTILESTDALPFYGVDTNVPLRQSTGPTLDPVTHHIDRCIGFAGNHEDLIYDPNLKVGVVDVDVTGIWMGKAGGMGLLALRADEASQSKALVTTDHDTKVLYLQLSELPLDSTTSIMQ